MKRKRSANPGRSKGRSAGNEEPLSNIVMAQLAISSTSAAEPQQQQQQQQTSQAQADRDARNVSQRIDQDIEQNRRLLPNLGLGALGLDMRRFRQTKTRKVLLLLLLGPSNAGKTTFANQMRLFFDPDSVTLESEVHRLAMLLSLVTSIKILLSFMELMLQCGGGEGDQTLLQQLYLSSQTKLAHLVDLEQPLRAMLGDCVSPSFRDYSMSEPGIIDHDELASLTNASAKSVAIGSWARAAEALAQWRQTHGNSSPLVLTNGTTFRFPTLEERGEDIRALWTSLLNMGLVSGPAGLPASGTEESASSQQCVYLLSDSAQYYLREAPRITAADYRPSEDDLLNLRVATVGAQEHLLACTEELLYRVVDVSGATSAVRHWVQFFQSASAILFVVDSSAYNVPSSAVKPGSNKLADALALFAETVNHPLLQQISVLLFFNKTDLLRAKLQSRQYPLSKYFTDYMKADHSYHPAKEFIKQRFIRAAKNDNKKRFLYTHYLQATDSRSTRLTISALQDLLVRHNLEGVGLI